MIIKDIVQVGNPLLREKSKTISNIKAEATQKVINNLIESMRYHDLVGMAASQIGEKLRVFVTEVRETPYREPEDIDRLRIYINPRIVWSSKQEVVIYEGCGSVAYGDFFAPVRRPKKITIEAFDDRGCRFSFKVDGLLSRVIQHEHDHLQGVEFTEKITDMKEIMSSGEYKKRIVNKNS